VLRALRAAIWVWVTVVLRRVDRQGWRLVVVISAPGSILAGPSSPGAPTSRARLPAILPGGAVLLHALTPGVQDAVGVGSTVTEHR
jgi:hypothetical protein